MKRKRYSEEQIIGILCEAEASVPVADLCRKHGMSDAGFYKWRSKYGGMDVSDAKKSAPAGIGECQAEAASGCHAEQGRSLPEARTIIEAWR